MKILLIGGNGFLGRPVAERLSEAGHEIVVLHRGNRRCDLPSSVRLMISDAEQLSRHCEALAHLAPDVVVNFILSSGRQAQEMMNALRGIAGRVVAISSMDVYRACGVLHLTESGPLQPVPLTEESELRTKPAYSSAQMEMGKKIFSWMTDDYDKVPVERIVMSDPEVPGTVLRLPMVYGPGDPLHRFLPIVKRIRDGRRKIILQNGCASWRGPKGYIENVVQAIALAAISPRATGRIYNVAEADALTELEWARHLAKEMNWDGEFVVLPKDRVPAHLLDDGNRAQHWVASSERIRQELGYEEKIPRVEAVRRTIQWELDYPPAAIPEAMFDYAAEDRALEAAVNIGV